jgi:Rrf2 family protein
MRYVQSTELAIDSLFFMAAHPEWTDFSVEQTAQAQGVSPSYLAKVFQQLVRAGLLRSHRGAKGGYMLGRAPADISLLDVAVVFEGTSPLYACNAHTKRCDLGPKCMIIETFKEAEKKMHDVLRGVSIQDIVDRATPNATWVGPANGQAKGLVVPDTTPLEQLQARQ